MSAQTDLRKADTEGPESTPGGRQADSAKSNPVPTQKSNEPPKTLFFDPYAIVDQLGYKDKPTPVTYGTLRAIVAKTPIIQAILKTRIDQLASFTKVQHDRYSMGFRIKVRDTEKEPTKAERQWIKQMENLIVRTGVTDNPRGRDNFNKFLRKLAWDSLVYDQMAFEIVPNMKGEPAEWYAVDASTIRLADTATTYMDEDLTDTVRYVQIYDGMVISEYTQEEMAFGIRNPRTDLLLNGYGIAELEMLIPAITAYLYAYQYNQKFFTQGSAAKGIINFKGTMNQAQLESFRRHWYNMISHTENAWRTPVVNSEDLQYVNLQQSSRDMEFNAWMDFLIKSVCSIYSIDPIEVNFKYGNVGQKGALAESSNKEKITESKERGLRPLLDFFADIFNTNILWPINENFEFAFVGLDAKTSDEVVELNTKRVKTYRTVDELRAEDDLPPLPDGKGEVILDPTWLQYAQMQQAGSEEQQEGAMGEGEPEENSESKEPEQKNNTNFEALLAELDGESTNKSVTYLIDI